MMMSLIFIVGCLSLLLLPLTCLSIFHSFQFQQQQHQNTSSNDVANNNTNIFHSYLSNSNLSSVLKLLIFPSSTHSKTSSAAGPERAATDRCSVCLCRIQAGEAATELSCGHVFHAPCLGAWIGTGRATCPLCRGRVGSPALDDAGAQVLSFRFCSFASASRQGQGNDNWWLR